MRAFRETIRFIAMFLCRRQDCWGIFAPSTTPPQDRIVPGDGHRGGRITVEMTMVFFYY